MKLLLVAPHLKLILDSKYFSYAPISKSSFEILFNVCPLRACFLDINNFPKTLGVLEILWTDQREFLSPLERELFFHQLSQYVLNLHWGTLTIISFESQILVSFTIFESGPIIFLNMMVKLFKSGIKNFIEQLARLSFFEPRDTTFLNFDFLVHFYVKSWIQPLEIIFIPFDDKFRWLLRLFSYWDSKFL